MSTPTEAELQTETDQKIAAKKERKANSKRLDLAMIMTVSVAIMSLCALVVSFYQAHLMNEQSSIIFTQGKASALPILEFDNMRSFNENGIERFEIVVANKGTGPLIIKNILFKYKGEAITNWSDLFGRIPNTEHVSFGISNEILNGSVLSANEQITFINSNVNSDLAQLMLEAMDDVKIKVCYVSIYDDWFQTTVKGLENRVSNTNENIPFCKIDDDKSFMD